MELKSTDYRYDWDPRTQNGGISYAETKFKTKIELSEKMAFLLVLSGKGGVVVMQKSQKVKKINI